MLECPAEDSEWPVVAVVVVAVAAVAVELAQVENLLSVEVERVALWNGNWV